MTAAESHTVVVSHDAVVISRAHAEAILTVSDRCEAGVDYRDERFFDAVDAIVEQVGPR